MQKLYFLPLAESDFIYSIVAEELGMIGALGVVALFVVFALARPARRLPRARAFGPLPRPGASPR